jgi:co-chaperonin GroES (HSP10)
MQKLIDTLNKFELTGNSMIIEDLEEAKKEETTASGIIVSGQIDDGIKLKRATVLKAGKGYVNEQGVFVKNPVQTGAVIYYKNAGDYELEGIKFKGTELGQVVAYKNKTKENGQSID